MGQINLSNSAGRDAQVATQHITSPFRVRWVDEDGRPASVRRIVRGTLAHGYDTLLKKFGDEESLAEALKSGDPEVDIETFGSFLSGGSRVYINEEDQIVHSVEHWEIVYGADGEEKEKRRKDRPEQNINTEIPLKWTGKKMKKADVYKRFVFAGKIQILHHNGITFDFLYDMAKELAESESLMLLGSGPKGAKPLILRRGATPYRGFLEGRIDGQKYALILHLSNMELKAPEEG